MTLENTGRGLLGQLEGLLDGRGGFGVVGASWGRGPDLALHESGRLLLGGRRDQEVHHAVGTLEEHQIPMSAGQLGQQGPGSAARGVLELQQAESVRAYLRQGLEASTDQLLFESTEEGARGALASVQTTLLKMQPGVVWIGGQSQTKDSGPLPRVIGLEHEHHVTRGKGLNIAQPKGAEEIPELLDELLDLTGVEAQESSSSTL
jgi:hypothetical protein